jgi:hypothetical protein
MGRYGTLDEAAGAVAFLASDDAGFITAAALPLDGGITQAFHCPGLTPEPSALSQGHLSPGTSVQYVTPVVQWRPRPPADAPQRRGVASDSCQTSPGE